MNFFSRFCLSLFFKLFIAVSSRKVLTVLGGAACLLIFSSPILLAAEMETSLLKRCWTAAEYQGQAKEIFPKRAPYKPVGGPVAGPVVRLGTPIKSFSPTKTPMALRGSIRRVKLPAGKKLIAITFDLCEAHYEIAGYDGRVIDYLRAQNIKATLFVGGKWLESHPLRAQQLIADPLFEIGSHGWSQKNLRKVHGKHLVDEISRVQIAYSRAFAALSQRQCMKDNSTFTTPLASLFQQTKLINKPEQLSLFRFPFGTCNKHALEAVYHQGQLAIQWDVVTGDPSRGQSARRIAHAIERQVKPGSIIIAHANGRGHHTAKALPLIIPKLLAQGYQFVTISELLKAGEPEIAKSCYESRPGDNGHY